MKISPQAKRVHLPEVVGKGYGTFWNFKGRYRVCKGSRASKKSKTTALNIIKRMMQYPEANTLVVRKVFRTLKDSCFTELKWAINRLGVSAYLAISKKPDVKSAFGLDFGYTNDPTALFCGLVSEKERTIWVFDELYEKALTNRAICDRITGMGYGKERIKADCAEPKSIDELRDAGLHRIRAARKGKDSVNNGIQYIQGYTIIVHPRCVNFITEISNYTWSEDKFGAKINVPIDDFNHLMDAMRYGLEDMLVGPAFSFD